MPWREPEERVQKRFLLSECGFNLLNFSCGDSVAFTGAQGPRSLCSETTVLVFIEHITHMFQPNVFIVYNVCVIADKTAGNE